MKQRTYMKFMGSELRMNFSESINYKFGFITDIIIYIALYSVFILTGSGYKLTQQYTYGNSRVLVLSAYIVWLLSLAPINEICNDIRSENIRGTLEQKLMSVYPTWWILFCKMLSSILVMLLEVAAVLAIAALVLKVYIVYNLWQILIIVVDIIGMSGLALMMGAVVLDKKSIGQFLLIVQIALLFLSNVVTKVSSGFLEKLIPLSYANRLVRLIAAGNSDIGQEVVMFSVISAIWLLLGICVFNKMIKNCKKKGTISLF